MAASLKIKWSKAAELELDGFYQLILSNFTSREANLFLDQVEDFENVIAKFPELFISSNKKKNLRIGYINKFVSCIYEIRRNEIFIVTLIDNRSEKNPR